MIETPILTVQEVASYLQIPHSTIYKLAQEGRIPCRKVGRHWRFHKPTIDRWLSGAGFNPSMPERPMKLIDSSNSTIREMKGGELIDK